MTIGECHIHDGRMRGQLDDGSWTTIQNLQNGRVFLKNLEAKVIYFLFLQVKKSINLGEHHFTFACITLKSNSLMGTIA